MEHLELSLHFVAMNVLKEVACKEKIIMSTKQKYSSNKEAEEYIKKAHGGQQNLPSLDLFLYIHEKYFPINHL